MCTFHSEILKSALELVVGEERIHSYRHQQCVCNPGGIQDEPAEPDSPQLHDYYISDAADVTIFHNILQVMQPLKSEIIRKV